MLTLGQPAHNSRTLPLKDAMTTDPRTGCLPNLAALIIGSALFCAGILFSELWRSPHASTDDLQQQIIQLREELAQLKQHQQDQTPSTEITRESLARRPGEDINDWTARLKRETPFLAEPPEITPKGKDVVEDMMQNIRRLMDEGEQDNNDQPPQARMSTIGSCG